MTSTAVRWPALGALNNPVLRVTSLLTTLAVTGFLFVEMTGVPVTPTLLRSALGTSGKTVDPARGGADGSLQSRLKPRITGDMQGNVVDAEARAVRAVANLGK